MRVVFSMADWKNRRGLSVEYTQPDEVNPEEWRMEQVCSSSNLSNHLSMGLTASLFSPGLQRMQDLHHHQAAKTRFRRHALPHQYLGAQ